MASDPSSAQRQPGSLREVATLFLRLGVFAFGGPAAHIAMMRDEVVRRRGWLDDQEFLDLVGATNLIPGPNSTEMAIHLGHRRGGARGLAVAGVLFILPASLIVLALAVAYDRYGTTPQAEWLLYGVKPVVIAIVLQALWGLGRRAVRGPGLGVVGLGAAALYLLGTEVLLLLAAGAAAAVTLRLGVRAWGAVRPGVVLLPLLATTGAAAGTAAFSMTALFLAFLKVGAVLYGSGYVLLAFLRADFVDRLGWLTDAQLIDAVAIGQVTPGPVFTTATFVGYLVGGWEAAVVATVAIFLPSFVFVALLTHILPLIRRSAWTGSALDGVNVASLGLMAGVAWQLGRAAIVDPFTAVTGLTALALVMRTRINATWLVVGGGAAGVTVKLALA